LNQHLSQLSFEYCTIFKKGGEVTVKETVSLDISGVLHALSVKKTAVFPELIKFYFYSHIFLDSFPDFNKKLNLNVIEQWYRQQNDEDISFWDECNRDEKIDLIRILQFFADNAYYRLEFVNGTVRVEINIKSTRGTNLTNFFSDTNVFSFEASDDDRGFFEFVFQSLKKRLILREESKEKIITLLYMGVHLKLFHFSPDPVDNLTFSLQCQELFQSFLVK
jgi:hypothetical protein